MYIHLLDMVLIENEGYTLKFNGLIFSGENDVKSTMIKASHLEIPYFLSQLAYRLANGLQVGPWDG